MNTPDPAYEDVFIRSITGRWSSPTTSAPRAGTWGSASSRRTWRPARTNLRLHTAPLRVGLWGVHVRAGQECLGRRPIFGRSGGLLGSGAPRGRFWAWAG